MQKPPHDFSRSPRSLSAHLNYLKASELRSWLLYYSLPLLLDRLPPLYFHHFALFVGAIHFLLQSSISLSELNAAEEMIKDFLKLLPELYGERSCTANSHALEHIPQFIRHWGPLWTHSAFGFESKNGHLKNTIHGKCHALDQLVFAVDAALTLEKKKNTLNTDNDDTIHFIANMTGHAPRANMTLAGEHLYKIGQSSAKSLSDEEACVVGSQQAPVFGRAFYNGVVFHSCSYTLMPMVNEIAQYAHIEIRLERHHSLELRNLLTETNQ